MPLFLLQLCQNCDKTPPVYLRVITDLHVDRLITDHCAIVQQLSVSAEGSLLNTDGVLRIVFLSDGVLFTALQGERQIVSSDADAEQ